MNVCVLRIVVHNPFFVICDNFPQNVLLTLQISPISCNRLQTVCDGFSPNNDFKASVFDLHDVPKRCRSLTSKSPALKRRNRYLQVLWYKTPLPSTEHIDLHHSSLVGTCREYSVEYAAFGGSSYSNYFVRLSLPLNLDLRLFTNYKPNTTKTQNSRILFEFYIFISKASMYYSTLLNLVRTCLHIPDSVCLYPDFPEPPSGNGLAVYSKHIRAHQAADLADAEIKSKWEALSSKERVQFLSIWREEVIFNILMLTCILVLKNILF
uniref:Anoctamin n=1 Tax=Heterorhabditis bacteriophora TaxID=37862 RepID=A0A1I7WFX9_HETBA